MQFSSSLLINHVRNGAQITKHEKIIFHFSNNDCAAKLRICYLFFWFMLFQSTNYRWLQGFFCEQKKKVNGEFQANKKCFQSLIFPYPVPFFNYYYYFTIFVFMFHKQPISYMFNLQLMKIFPRDFFHGKNSDKTNISDKTNDVWSRVDGLTNCLTFVNQFVLTVVAAETC